VPYVFCCAPSPSGKKKLAAGITRAALRQVSTLPHRQQQRTYPPLFPAAAYYEWSSAETDIFRYNKYSTHRVHIQQYIVNPAV